ncbi:MAG: iron-sulfur cluster assembly accessory protein [Methanosarcinaceae archaeon]|nr:iron-sulfur cluster assembly accessory protein [Methanosarcinaceae archaeon]MDD4498562.1 iron-sulfur cluster assembly accessory protein [Methanosarcinaceae archaeon]
MIEVTDKAAAELKAILETDEKDVALRIYVAGVACSGIQYGLALDEEEKEDDIKIESNGIKLVMTKDVEEGLAEGKIDFIEDENGKGFLIRTPNVGGCGTCGSCH